MRPPLVWISVAFGAGLCAGLGSLGAWGAGMWAVGASVLIVALAVARQAPVGAAIGLMGVAGLLDRRRPSRRARRAARPAARWGSAGAGGAARPARATNDGVVRRPGPARCGARVRAQRGARSRRAGALRPLGARAHPLHFRPA